jgi:photosystem II stability/assembly factor-like uncharacterized protein
MNKKGKRINTKDKNLYKNKKNQKRNLYIMISVAILFTIAITTIGYLTTSMNQQANTLGQNLTGNWMDIHGLGIVPLDNGNSNNSLYLATHNGLFKKDNSSTNSWVEAGNDKSDLMGFTIDLSNKGVMYSSGHPQTGGNLGFRISNDYGGTWQKVSDVTSPTPIDFHTMTIGNNPKTIYAAGGMVDNIFISTDGGKNWTITSPPDGQQVVTLAANKSNSNILYAGTTNGLFSSINQGKNWQEINDELVSGNTSMITGIEISLDGKTAYAFAVPNQPDSSSGINGYIIKSIDGAKSWTKTDGQIPGSQFVSKFAFDNNNGVIYAALIQDSTETGVASSVYSSNDDGNSWTLEGTNNNKLLTK